MGIEDKRKTILGHLKTIKEEQSAANYNTAEKHFNHWLSEIVKSKKENNVKKIELSYQHAIYMAIQMKNYKGAGNLLEKYKKQEIHDQSNWYNRYAIQIYSNSPRHFLDHPQDLLKHLEPIVQYGSNAEKSKISNTLLSYVYIYENIFSSKKEYDDFEVFKNFANTIIPISNGISHEYANRLENFKKLINNEIDIHTYNDIVNYEPTQYDLSNVENFIDDREEQELVYKKKSRILIIGQPAIGNDEIYATAKQYGYSRKSLEMYTDYDKMKNLDIKRFRNDEKYDGIIIGPIPHSVKGRDYDSVISGILSSENGYPYWIKCKSESGELKMTKSAFEKAIQGISLNQRGVVL